MSGVERPSLVRVSARFLRLGLRRWPALLLVGATTVLEIALAVAQPWPLKVLVDNVLGDRPLDGRAGAAFEALPGATSRENLLLWTLVAGVLVFVLLWAARLAGSYASVAFGQRVVYDLGARLFDHLQRLSLRFHARHGIGSMVRRITTDTESVSTILTGALIPAIGSVLALGSIVVVMWNLDQTLTLLSLGVLPIMALALRLYSRPMAERSYENNEAEGELYNTVEQTLAAMPVVQAFGGEAAADRRFADDTRRALGTAISALNVQLRFSILAGLATALGTAAILWFGARHALDGGVTVGTIIVFLSYLAALYAPLDELTATSSTLQEAAGGAWRVTEILDSEPDVRERPGAPDLPPLAGHVRLEAVTVAYEPGRPVLSGVTLEARPGETIGLVGATGAGKTTLVSLLPRFLDPDEGRVTLDGHDVREVSLSSVRSQVALVLQESFLFPTTVGANIAYGRPGASREQIERAARAAAAHEFIERLPAGYETPVGERGATLSGGERQRIAIARALLRDAPILVLDEPTSALDAETERELLVALRALMAGRTTFLIAHRLSSVREADRICVLAGGRLVEQGSHEELLEQGGAYARMVEAQAGRRVEVPA